jgi:NADH-quinone oxidoreductase subunit J
VTVAFYIAGAVALISTLLVVTRRNTIHALLYLVVSLFAVAVVFYTLGAPFVAALEVIVYAGAIIVLFLFTVMLLNIGRADEAEERDRLRATVWIGPGLLAVVLLAELAWAISTGATAQVGARVVEPREVGVALYGPYAVGVELASTLLLAALIGARHLGQRQRELAPGQPSEAAGGFADGPAAGGAGLAATEGEAPVSAAAVSATAVSATAVSAAATADAEPADGESAADASEGSETAKAAPGGAAAPPAGREPRGARFWRKDEH